VKRFEFGGNWRRHLRSKRALEASSRWKKFDGVLVRVLQKTREKKGGVFSNRESLHDLPVRVRKGKLGASTTDAERGVSKKDGRKGVLTVPCEGWPH